MPNVGYFLELLEAISRRDFGAVAEIGKSAAESERKKKHFSAAHRISAAVESATSLADFDRIGTVAAPIRALQSAPPPQLHLEDSRESPPPILNSESERLINEFLREWSQEEKLIRQGLHPRRTLLLFGPPGSGKTLTARYISSRLRIPLFTVRFDALVSSYLGETSNNIKSVFEFVASNRCILFIDELDAIAKMRDDTNELGELKRVVISLLQNFDFARSSSLIIGATNHPHMLDPAIWRRFEAIVELRQPDSFVRVKILERLLERSFEEKVKTRLAEITDGLSGSELEHLASDSKRRFFLEDTGLIPDEALLLSLLDRKRITMGAKTEQSDSHDKIAIDQIAQLLRELFPRKYSFQKLATLTGISHSTLHHRSRGGNVKER